MPLIILAALIGVPILEIALFIEVGGAIGLWPTIAIVVATAVLGTALMRRQGLAVLASAQRELAEDRLPVRELFSGVCLLVGGALLLTPGFFTDALGLALLLPPLRAVLGRLVIAGLKRSPNVQFTMYSAGPAGPPPGPGPGPGSGPGPGRGAGGGRGPRQRGPIIEGEEFGVRREDENRAFGRLPPDPRGDDGAGDGPDHGPGDGTKER